ncbi:MAG: mannosyltransferase family protein [Sporomusaceae bacterium]|nr:mannosyltransferase family protein [Sporomusaceae bacterium]
MKFYSPAIIACCLHTALVAAAFPLSGLIPSRAPAGFINESLPAFATGIDQLIKWDAHWYTHIAQHGYDAHSVVFFPAIILCIKALTSLGLSYSAAGLTISNIFGFLSFQIMYQTFKLDYSEQISRRALIAYAVMPTSFFINSIYTESLFLFFSLSCVYQARQKNWLKAGCFGACSALTRNLGVFLFFYLVYEYRQSVPHCSRCRRFTLPLFFPVGAVLAYMAFNHYIAGTPLAFLDSQKEWGRFFNSPLANIYNNIILTLNGNPYIQPGATLDTVSVCFALAGLICSSCSSQFRIRGSYLLIGWLWLLVPLLSTSTWLPLYSISRFILVIFPLYLFWAQLRDRWYYGSLVVSAATLCICAALFINWHWIG